jgi:lipopolysaccharide/colanic/teichoic acid biosynthesis glycosyltransferase
MRKDYETSVAINYSLRKHYDIDLPYAYLRLRRISELILVILLSPLLIAAMSLIAIPVIIRYKGKFIFKQIRIGRNGKEFTIYKFRTMTSPEPTSANCSDQCNSKIGKLGCFLRCHRLDELPQFWNVIKGDMSIIGPRPEVIKEYELYEKNIEGYKLRKLVPQGITGWAQINFPHSDTIMGNKDKLEYDLYYLTNLSQKLDIMIIYRTLLLIFKGKISNKEC